MERKFKFAEDEIYHIYNRGVEKRKIFLDDKDYARMELLLFLCNSQTHVNVGAYERRGVNQHDLWSLDIGKPLVDIGAWCLMPNHFHLLIRESREGGISRFMLKITTAYSMYFNIKNRHPGSLFQGTFKAEHVSEDRYLQYLFSYIHLNPVKIIPGESGWKDKGITNIARANNFLDSYQHSSLIDYRKPKSRPQSAIIDTSRFPWKFRSVEDLNDEVVEWMGLQRPEQG